jgi:uncharacterized membrane protein
MQTVREVVALEQRDDVGMDWSDRLADVMTAFSGSMLFVGLHGIWFAVWIAANLRIFGLPAFDPFPFGLLTMLVSLEAIFLSTFVLISQNRQALKADRRAKVDLQVNLISEREVTKLMELVADMHKEMGLSHRTDPEVAEMQEQTHVRKIADAVDRVEQKVDPKSARGPRSAADTET